MALDMLDRLTPGPGTRTLGELLQEREWAVGEIRRLRLDVSRLSRKHEARRIEREISEEAVDKKKASRPGTQCTAANSARGGRDNARDWALDDL